MLYSSLLLASHQLFWHNFERKIKNLEAIAFLRDLNREVYGRFPDVQTIAEESTDWPMVTRPVFLGGLGFGMKWNMDWMHDTLAYMSLDSIFRSYHQNQLTFSIWYGREIGRASCRERG